MSPTESYTCTVEKYMRPIFVCVFMDVWFLLCTAVAPLLWTERGWWLRYEIREREKERERRAEGHISHSLHQLAFCATYKFLGLWRGHKVINKWLLHTVNHMANLAMERKTKHAEFHFGFPLNDISDSMSSFSVVPRVPVSSLTFPHSNSWLASCDLNVW